MRIHGLLAASILFLTQTHAGAGMAKPILKTNGDRPIICAVVGCENSKARRLICDLAASGNVHVHAIALNEPSLVRARKAIGAAGLSGLASVEKLPVNPLPYRDHMVNLLLVPDLKAARKAGFSFAEAHRAVAPGGRLCIRKFGTWQVQVMPWPEGMGEWTHPYHGPEGNMVSEDKLVKFPLGFRWNGGLPMNLHHPKLPANVWSSTRGIAVAKGRVFTLTMAVLENLGPTFESEHGQDQYVTARDAFNGLLLWRTNIGATYYGGLFYPNKAPFVAVDDRVFVAHVSGSLHALDAATGETALTYPTTHIPGVIVVDGNVVAAATWKDGTRVGATHGINRSDMTVGLKEGVVEAFDVETAEKLWALDRLAISMRSANGKLFMVQRGPPCQPGEGNEKTSGPYVLAVDLQSGAILWETPGDSFGGAKHLLRLDVAGAGIVAVSHNNGAQSTVLSAANGDVVFQANTKSYAAIYDGRVALGGRLYNAATGAQEGTAPFSLGHTICTPRIFVNDILIDNRSGALVDHGKGTSFGGARGGCLLGSVPACGALYTPRNWCNCLPSQIPGMICFGPVAAEPTPEAMRQAPVVERGPAFAEGSPDAPAGSWHMYRQNAERSSATSEAAPAELKTAWSQTLVPATPTNGIARNWPERLADSISGVVAEQDLVLAALRDRQQVIALEGESGVERWRYTAGGRIDTPPALLNDLCLFGAHDGYVYALRGTDGALVWRLRIAPTDERMVSYGQVASPWPVIGGVMISDGLGYACAGRTQGAGGGIVVRAFKPDTGEHIWSQVIAPGGAMRINDLLIRAGGAVQLMTHRMDLKTGALGASPGPGVVAPTIGNEGFIDPSWPRLGNRKYQNMGFGNIRGMLTSWSDTLVATCPGRGRVDAFERTPTGGGAKRWSHDASADYQVTSLVICPNAVAIAGGIYPKEGEPKGFVRLLDPTNGNLLTEQVLASPAAYEAIAVSSGRILVPLQDGSLVCLSDGT